MSEKTPEHDEWKKVTAAEPEEGRELIVCWRNNAVMVAYRSRGEWYSAIQKADERGLATIIKLDSAPSHFRRIGPAPRETWDAFDTSAWGG